jgi:hypothetical protein
MDTRGRLARTGAAQIGRAIDAFANGMVKDHDAICLQGCPQESFGGG